MKIREYSDLAVDFLLSLAGQAKERMAALEADGKKDTADYELAKKTVRLGDESDRIRKSGGDRILYKAPAVMIFHSHSATSSPKDNCVITSTTAGLTARTMGLEFC